jgi:FkbM family methyltransferase
MAGSKRLFFEGASERSKFDRCEQQPMKKNKALVIYEAAKFYYVTLGVRGFIAVLFHYLTGWPRLIKVVPPDMRHPVYLRLRTSDVVLYNFILLGEEYRFDVSEFAPRTIVDAGANIGLCAIYYASKYPTAKIIAVEPEDSNYRVMLKNIAPYSNIIPVQAALWKADGRVSIGLADNEAREKWAFLVTGDKGNTTAFTLGSLLSKFHIQTVDLLKMDIEGAEKEVFESCDWIDRIVAIVIETHDRMKPGCTEAVQTATRGFDRWSRGELTFYNRPNVVADRPYLVTPAH